MHIDTSYDGPNYLIQQVYVEDMKLENREYGNVVSLNHVLLNG